MDYARIEPASKFGIACKIDVVGLDEIAGHFNGVKMYLYTSGRTWMTDGPVTPKQIAALLASKRERKWPPILSNVHVKEKPRPLN